MRMILIYLTDSILIIHAKYDVSSNDTVEMELGEIAFFQTSDYPKLNQYSTPQLTFSLKQQNYSNIQMIAVISRIDVNLFGITEFLIIKDFFSFGDFGSFHENNFFALKGYIYVEKDEGNCPFQTFANPYHFTDETEIIYLQTFFQNYSVSQNYSKARNFCKWNFTSPAGYGFKIVITVFDLSSSSDFMVINTTDIIVNKRSAKILHPYYNNDESIQITVSNAENNNFQAYVSIVKTNPAFVDGNCTQTINDDNSVTWTTEAYGDYESSGYLNNIHCSYNVTIKPNTQIYVQCRLHLEDFVDNIKYNTRNNKSGILTGEFDDPNPSNEFTRIKEYLFNSKDEFVSFDFQSDGSVEGGGFSLQFFEILCECNPNNITCDDDYYYIFQNSQVLRNNIHCHIIIEPCGTDMLYLVIDIIDSIYHDNLIYQIYSNNLLVFDMVTTPPKSLYYIYLNASNENFLEINIFPNNPVLKTAIFAAPYNAVPVDEHIIFSSEKTSHDLDSGLFTLAVMEMSESLIAQNITFVIFGSFYMFFEVYRPLIYNNETFSIDLVTNENCEIYSTTFKCNIKEAKFAILMKKDVFEINAQFLSIELSKKTNNCVFKETVFIPKGSTNFSISQISTKENECLIKFLLGVDGFGSYFIEHLWTTSATENVQIFSGIGQEKLFLEFNSKTWSQWKEIGLFSFFYNIKIPKNSAIFLRIVFKEYRKVQIAPIEKDDEIPNVVYINLEFPFRSVISTPHYATTKSSPICANAFFITYVINDDYVKFTVLDYKDEDPDNDIFTFSIGDNSINVNQIGDVVGFRNETVTLYYACIPGKLINEGILFLIEAFNCTNETNDVHCEL